MEPRSINQMAMAEHGTVNRAIAYNFSESHRRDKMSLLREKKPWAQDGRRRKTGSVRGQRIENRVFPTFAMCF